MSRLFYRKVELQVEDISHILSLSGKEQTEGICFHLEFFLSKHVNLITSPEKILLQPKQPRTNHIW